MENVIEKNKLNNKFSVIFQSLQKYEADDTRFEKVKIWLLYVGKTNLNGSYFSKEVVEENLHTLANTPILAYIEENSEGELDFSDHRMVLERTEDDIKVVYKGKAIGIIPETNNAKWETRVTDSGEELEYLTVEGLLWTKWDDSIDIMNRKQFTSQSMELHEDGIEGYWDDEGIYHFTKFSFFGACLLGDDVMPAMQNSTAELQFSSNKEVNKTIEDKLNEFSSLFSTKGGNDLEKKVQETEEVVETFEKTEEVTTEETLVENFEKVEDEKVESTEFEVDGGYVDEVIREAVQEVADVIVDVVEKVADNSSDDIMWSISEEEYKEVVAKFEVEKELLLSELNELRAFKRSSEEKELIDKFTGKLLEDEITEVLSISKEFSIEQVEEKLLVLFGKKNFSLTKENEKPVSKVNIQYQKDDEDHNPYKAFFSK